MSATLLKFFMLATILLTQQSFASSACSDSLDNNLSFFTSQQRPLSFQNVEVFRRNNNIGPQQRGSIQFEQWVELEYSDQSANYVGLTSDGVVYQLIQFPGRRIARRLSGQKEFQKVFLSESGRLAAVDKQGVIHLYYAKRWQKRNGKLKLTGQALATWSVVTLATFGFMHQFLGVDVVNPFLTGYVAGAAGMSSLLVYLNRFQHFNTYPDGFLNTKVPFQGVRSISELLTELEPPSAEERWHFKVPNPELIEPELPEELTQPIE